jgi:DNA topoisomerase I
MKLIVTEKNDVAKRISGILSNGSARNVGEKKIPIYQFSDGDEVKCVGMRGHILEVNFPEEYKNWKEPPPSSLLDAEIIKYPKEKSLVSILRKLSKEADHIIIATDYDREGELIGLDVRNIAAKANKGVSFSRARFSALTPTEINSAFESLDSLDENLAYAGEARQDIDLVWGASLTRHLSIITNRLWKNFLSAGRVQSPTLAILVKREKEIRAFIPEDYWQIKILCEKNGDFIAYHKAGRFKEEEKARKIFEKLGDIGTVTSVDFKERTIRPPAPFSTTSFLTAASSLNVSPSNAMRIAERLYTQGFISYPRVDNTVYPKSLNLRDTLNIISSAAVVGQLAKELTKKSDLKPTRGKNFSTDHPPIYPTGVPNKEKLKPQEWKIWELVARRFMATLADPAKARSTTIGLDVSDEPFIAKGDMIFSEGFLKYYPYMRKKDSTLPVLETGDEVKILDKELEAKQTQPPVRYTEGSLIKKMEELGLGTKSTRHSIIQTLKNRRYAFNNPLQPSETGIAVCESLMKHAHAVTTPDMTAKLEEDMNEVAEGKKSFDEVTVKSYEALRKILDEMEAKKKDIGEEVNKGLESDNIVGKCPECGNNLIIRKAKKSGKRFVGCSGYPECKKSYPLPQKGSIVSTGQFCENCGSPKIKIITKGKKPWEICIDINCST